MKLSGNTIFITGGGSGIGRGLAVALHARGNKIIISGRRRTALDATIAENPGMAAIELDVTDAESIVSAAAKLIADYPALNVLINNAGVMMPDSAAGWIDDGQMVATIATNLMGPIRLTSALIGHLKAQQSPVVAYTTSVLGFVPKSMTAVYSATKAALHSYILSQRFQLRDAGVQVIEIAPPWVRTELMNSSEAEQAMPLDQFITQAIELLGGNNDEILVDAVRPLRANVGPNEHAFVNQFNENMAALFANSPTAAASA